jgi:hypothetical protein
MIDFIMDIEGKNPNCYSKNRNHEEYYFSSYLAGIEMSLFINLLKKKSSLRKNIFI